MVCLVNSRYGWNGGFEVEGMVREEAVGKEQEIGYEWHCKQFFLLATYPTPFFTFLILFRFIQVIHPPYIAMGFFELISDLISLVSSSFNI